jgi:hypothetical protein
MLSLAIIIPGVTSCHSVLLIRVSCTLDMERLTNSLPCAAELMPLHCCAHVWCTLACVPLQLLPVWHCPAVLLCADPVG